DGLWYYKGSKFTGYVRRYSSDVLWYVKNGVGGTKLTGIASTSKYYLRTDTGVRSKGDGKYYKSGKVYTGYVADTRTYYKSGKTYTSLSGWKTIGGKEDYFTKGVAASGTKRIKRNGYTYTYTFRSDGSLVTDLFAYNSSYKKKKLHIVLARGSHTGTILAYNSSTKKYDIPVKSFVISMSRKSSNTRAGTYKLTQRKRWWQYSSKLWYQYATYVSGSGSWTHSEQYSKASVKALKYSSYNGLGTNQSKTCIRMQVVNCKLIYDLASTNNSNTRVVITKGNGYLPFGKMTLSNNYDATGKISSSQKYDPTDPAV
ncbi:MAG: L,D-transpeptidase, partial [Clostridiales bacterium]|nr:L,D-transpeptidase [Clostridiales bacterium]